MGFHFAQFISAPGCTKIQSIIEDSPPFPISIRHCLITGPPRSGKTTLLFHYAVSVAAEGKQVVYITLKDKVEESPPALPPGITHDSPLLKNIVMRYLKNSWELRKYASCFHLLDPKPAAIIVDDISAFVEEKCSHRKDHDRDLTMTLAWLYEAVASWGHFQADATDCHVVVSDTSDGDGPKNQYLYQRWLPLILSIRSGPEKFMFSVTRAPGTNISNWQGFTYHMSNGVMNFTDDGGVENFRY